MTNQADGFSHLFDVFCATVAAGNVLIEPCTRRFVENALEIISDELDEFLARERVCRSGLSPSTGAAPATEYQLCPPVCKGG